MSRPTLHAAPAFRSLRRGLSCLVALSALLRSTAVSAAPDPEEWHARYERAKKMLAEGRAAEAAAEFETLAYEAPTTTEERLVRELEAVALATAQRQQKPPPAPHVRSSDELT